MNLELWKLFYEVACAKNISKASEKLHISQPAITKQIKKLEEELNCKLFIRNQKGVILTQDGETIFQDIKNALNAFELAEKKLKDNNELITGTIKIGITTSLAKSYLMPYIRKFHQLYPNIIFEISTDPTSLLKQELKKGKIDFIIAKFPPRITDEFEYIKIGTRQDCFVVNENYGELINKPLKLSEISNYPILLQKQPSSSRDYIENYCQNYNIKLHSVMEIASSNLLIEFAKIGSGIGVVTKEYIQKELSNKELYELNVNPKIPPRDFGIISLKENYLSKCSDEFYKYLINNRKAF